MIRYAAICLATLVLVVGGAAIADWHTHRHAIPIISGGASLSIAGPSFAKREQAVLYAGAISAAGHSAYLRLKAEQNQYQVLVGPFVTTGEAQAAQRALARRGLADTRLFVDDSLRTETAAPRLSWWQEPEQGPRLVAAAAPGIFSLVLELPDAPREVLGQRTASTQFEVDISPAGPAWREGKWEPPSGTLLLNHAETLRVDADRMRLRLDIPDEALSRVRLEGARVYIDLAWPDPPWPVYNPAPRTLQARSTPQPETSAPRPQQQQSTVQPDVDVEETITRFRQVQPFLLSAVDAPEPQVLAAVARTLEDMSAELAERAGKQPVRLRQAISMARDAASASFSGDRAVQARRAIELFDQVTSADSREPGLRQ